MTKVSLAALFFAFYCPLGMAESIEDKPMARQDESKGDHDKKDKNESPNLLRGSLPEDELARTRSLIRDPTPVGYSEFTGMVRVSSSYGACSGMLISKRTVLTAGHCVCDADYVGSNDCDTRATVTFRRSSTGYDGDVTVHPGYNPSWVDREVEDDIAIIKLDADAPWYAEPFDLSKSQVPTNAGVTIVGFGKTGSDCDASNGILNKDTDRIDRYVDGGKIIQFDDADVTCEGDSGGAYIYGGKVVGVHSGRFPTISHGMVAKGASVHRYYDWIKENTCSSSLWTRCSSSGPICQCGSGIGDCDRDDECAGSLVCHHNVGATFGYAASVDVCYAPGSVDPGTCGCASSGFATVCTTVYNYCATGFYPTCNPLSGACGGCTCEA